MSEGVNPFEALRRAEKDMWHYWNEDDLVPVDATTFRAGLVDAMRHAREQGWIPAEDPGCQCLTCRAYVGPQDVPG